ncbi:GNAT family N-acetyltransferase [Pseudoflavitalea sp. G-6-1-2]|uniref:GNAT family N-acetyltransferase n=1 Tax=Pseudoflavitalea sp. G-6-1-2 TaxID=2728841 RepID=UPI001F10CCBC|nr:GNAT family N-acetyltransferase [Pseudoflavitalea sp. G-6-1-2]
MLIRNLTVQDTGNLLLAINGAFADYVVPYQLNTDQLQLKMASEHIQLELSAGVFEQNRMVATMMHGLRAINGSKIVYNAGTGVLPEFRGQGLVGKMYEYLLPLMKQQQVDEMKLEVIERNQSAIRAYEKNEFMICRKFLCFAGEIKTDDHSKVADIRPLKDYSWTLLQSFWDIEPSWQNAHQSIEIIQPKALGAYIDDVLVGYVIFNPGNNRVYQLAVSKDHRRKGIATQLFAEMRQQMPQAKAQMNNVDEVGEELSWFLKKQGLVNFINQFEMKRVI